MATVVGKSGHVAIGANTVAELKEWTLEVDAAMLDDTTFGATWKSFLPGILDGKGSLKGNWDVATDTNGQAALQAAILGGTVLTSLTLNVDGTNAYTCNAYLSKLQVDSKVESIVAFTADFQANGAVTYA